MFHFSEGLKKIQKKLWYFAKPGVGVRVGVREVNGGLTKEHTFYKIFLRHSCSKPMYRLASKTYRCINKALDLCLVFISFWLEVFLYEQEYKYKHEQCL